MYNNSRPVSYGDTQELTLYYNSFNPPIPGELIYDSKNRRLVIGDGNTPFALLKDINQQAIEDLINNSYIVIKEDVASLNNSLQSVEAGYRSEVSKIQEELSASATLYSQISNTIVVDILPDNPDTSKVYYTQHYNQYFVYDYENTTWKTIKSNSSNVILVESWSEVGKDTNKIYYTSTSGLLTYYYYTKEKPEAENPKWLSTQKPFTLLSDESLDNVENKSLLYYRYIPYIYYYYKDGEWKTTQSPEEAGVKVDTASVVTSINNGESNVNINADKINFVSKAFNIYPSDGNGNTTSTTPNFSVDNKGNVKVKGQIEADSGRLNYGIKIGDSDTYYTEFTSLMDESMSYGSLLSWKGENYDVPGLYLRNNIIKLGFEPASTSPSFDTCIWIYDKSLNDLGEGYDSYGTFFGVWSGLSLTSSPKIVSDKNKKNSIKDIDHKYQLLFDNLKPVSYKYNNGTSDRTHIGFIAQDVEEALKIAAIDTKDFAGFVIKNKDTNTPLYTLRYEEFIALNTNEIQKLKQRVKELEDKLKEIN